MLAASADVVLKDAFFLYASQYIAARLLEVDMVPRGFPGTLHRAAALLSSAPLLSLRRHTCAIEAVFGDEAGVVLRPTEE